MPPPAPALTLKQFMLRGQVIKLYRDFFRTTRLVSDSHQREEMNDWIRRDFKANRNVSVEEEETVKALLFNGEKMLRELRQSLELSEAKK